MKKTYSTYRAGDFLIRVKNSVLAKRSELSLPSTKLILAIARCLKKEGFLSEVKLDEGVLTVKIAKSHKEPVLLDLKLVSKPGLRVYKNVDDLKNRKKMSSILILSTSKGVMSQKDAIKENLGGEVLVEIW